MIIETILTSLQKYWGTDWMAMITTFISVYLLGNKRRSGFIYAALACVCWFVFGVLAGSVASPIANFFFIILNVRGYYKWQHPSQ